MRHNVKGKKLGRDSAHRKALLKNLSTSLIEHGSVRTTLSKAKYVRPYVEKLVTKAKVNNLHKTRQIKAGLTSNEMARKLVTEIAPSFSKKPGGYTKIVKLDKRPGDNTQMARIEWSAKIKKVKTEKKEEKKTPKKQAKPKATKVKKEKKDE